MMRMISKFILLIAMLSGKDLQIIHMEGTFDLDGDG